uniref:aldehyde oxidase GLOX-like n=1 Tax=Erigeron canadensis TaxID=72917 RepID=UPI001CB99D53|nr:aldehyde oxidase GLOX-like [Erigeron canadensis]
MALSTYLLYDHVFLFLFIFHLHAPPCFAAAGGTWKLLLENTGISPMHMQLLPTDRVMMYDRPDFGTSKILLPKDKCDPNLKDCSAHSVEYDVATNSIRPLMLHTDTWCSSGALMPQGHLIQTGGFGKGAKYVRSYKSCDTCDWEEIPNGLIEDRWYATNHILPDGHQIIIGGRGKFNYEFYPKKSPAEKTYEMPFLAETKDPNENNLYPFTFLNPDGNLLIFANNHGILYDYLKEKVIKTYPTMPGGHPRNYPSTGSATLLPLKMKGGYVGDVDVVICGGAPKASYYNALKGKFDEGLDTCGRIKVSDPDPKWVMETMPMARVMGDMINLPNGHVLMINGAKNGVAGWDMGRNPVLHPVIYRPDNKFGTRFEVQNPSTIPRMYHSTAIVLKDGRVLVAGSNPHEKYVYNKNALHPTELRLESFSPSYLDHNAEVLRPEIMLPKNNFAMHYGKPMVIQFDVPSPVDPKMISVTMLAPPFNTHSFSMHQRLLVLDTGDSTKAVGKNSYTVDAMAPPSGNVAPPGNYLVHVVHKEIPSQGIWVKIQ